MVSVDVKRVVAVSIRATPGRRDSRGEGSDPVESGRDPAPENEIGGDLK
jgi:hypothetical protein